MIDYPAIEQLLPHDEPMILIDRALNIGQDTVHCQVEIGTKNPFFNRETHTVPAYVGIEFMAQSLAAWSGYHAMEQGCAPPIGFLLGCRRYTSHCDAFAQGQILDIYAEKVIENSGMAVFSARIEIEQQPVASCQLNVYVPTEEQLQQMQIRNPQ